MQDDREALLAGIGRALEHLAFRLRLQASTGMLSLHSVLEDILCPILRIAWKLPDLQSTNRNDANAAVIDLKSESQKIGVQVTTERAAQKISSTIASLRSSGLDLQELRFVILVTHGTSYRHETRTLWLEQMPSGCVLDPIDGIIGDVPALFRILKPLDIEDLSKVHEILESSVFGSASINLPEQLGALNDRHLEYEKATLKYIPELFVETPIMKDVARCHIHPMLFSRMALDRLRKFDFEGFSDQLSEAGVTPFPGLSVPAIEEAATFEDAIGAMGPFKDILDTMHGYAKKCENLGYKRVPPEVPDELRHKYDALYPWLQNYGIYLRLLHDETSHMLRACAASILIFTSAAGQGKTMFVCDLCDKCLPAQGVPFAFFTGRYLSEQHEKGAGNAMLEAIFHQPAIDIDEGLERLDEYAKSLDRPFVFVIDAINEHRNSSALCQTLHSFLTACLRYHRIRVLLTCRSEFFTDRFGALLEMPVGPKALVVDHLDGAMSRRNRQDMVDRHLEHFKLTETQITQHVIDALEDDRILLRIFCEVYGGHEGCEPPTQIDSLYRREVFQRFLELKLEAASRSFAIQSAVSVSTAKGKLSDALAAVTRYMVEQGVESEIPLDTFPSELVDSLEFLLTEEVLLRRDLSDAPDVFRPRRDAVSFTFDEFRDFVVAEYLAKWVFPKSPDAFFDYVGRLQSKPGHRQAVEGVTRFLFHICRAPEHDSLRLACEERGTVDSAFTREIFNVRPEHVTDNDVARIVAMLKSEETYDRFRIARMLMVRVTEKRFPLLNSTLLVDTIYSSDEPLFALVRTQFDKWNEHWDIRESSEAIADGIKTMWQEGRSSVACRPWLRQLVLCLPVGQTPYLSSDAYEALEELASLRPGEVVPLLVEVLESKYAPAHALAWRLLANMESAFDPGPLRPLLVRDRTSDNFEIAREATRCEERRGLA
jgi:hypothetical protein